MKLILKHSILAAAALATIGTLQAQTAGSPQRRAQRPRPRPDFIIQPGTAGGATQFGDPLPGLTAAQLADFAAGIDEFENEEGSEGGLGPLFNGTSCVSCHSAPAIGGASLTMVTRFGKLSDGRFDSMEEKGGSLLQLKAIDPAVQEVVPQEANVVARRQSTPLFGLGLVEAIPDAAILENARRPNPDGIKGKPAMVIDLATGRSRVGHFGWKAQQATLLSFSADAYLNEMGITSRLLPRENAPNGDQALLAKFDQFADPEDEIDPATGKSDIDHAADFIRFLAPPPRLASTASSLAGERLFKQIGCAVCHQPSFMTGPSPIAALDRKPVFLYSDLLLHDMGRLGDGVAQGPAGPRDFKTPPLWGLRASGPYLHDARATTVPEAIRAHDGEGARSRERFNSLSAAAQKQLLDFLRTL